MHGHEPLHVTLPLIGDFNVANALAAAAVGFAVGLDARRDGRAPWRPAAGARTAGGDIERPTVLRDYAHTPDALERALAAVRPFTEGRDHARVRLRRRPRPRQAAGNGQAAEKGADVVIVTSDNPRTEDPERILDDIETGMTPGKHERIEDRRRRFSARSTWRSGRRRAAGGQGARDVPDRRDDEASVR